jgi:regulator of replication initiation timing
VSRLSLRDPSMRDAETAAARLWRDRAEIREHERDEARAQVRIAEQKLAILTAENDRLASENAQLRHQLDQDDTGMQMEAIRTALTPLLTEL